MVVIDATMLMLLLQPDASAACTQDGKPVERAVERVNHLINELDRGGESVAVPTPALAEVLVRVGAKASEQIVDKMSRHWALKIISFDARAAIEVAAMTRDAAQKNEGKGNEQVTWAKLKYDRQIIAIAKVNQATTIYSDDEHLRKLAKRAAIHVIGLADLALPPAKPAPEAPPVEEGDQMDLLKGGDA